jgi:CheY-like chemotaxis protein
MVGGWDVIAARSGSEGLIEARAEMPDAILLDVMMPDMDGPSTFQRLQSDSVTQGIPVIFLTAKVQAAEVRRFTDLGVSGVIAKPFDPLTLAQQVADTLGWAP